MATITLKAGDFGSGQTVVVGESAMHLPDPRMPGASQTVPFSAIADVEEVGEDTSRRQQNAVRLGLAGAAMLGPIGLVAGALALRKTKDITFMVRLEDGRHFVATADARAYAALRSARITGRTAADGTEEPHTDAIDAMITRYVAAKGGQPVVPASAPPPVAAPAPAPAAAPAAPTVAAEAPRLAAARTFGRRRA